MEIKTITVALKNFMIAKFSDECSFDNLCRCLNLKSSNFTGNFDTIIDDEGI